MTFRRFIYHVAVIASLFALYGCALRGSEKLAAENSETALKNAPAPAVKRPMAERLPAIPLSRVARIPARFLGAKPEEGAQIQSALLTFTNGAADELPQGPLCFDVSDDEIFIISDPLLQRLVYYDGEGRYLRQQEIGFAVDQIDILPQGGLRARKAKTGDYYQVDESGQTRQITGAAPESKTESAAIKSKIDGPNRGVITFPDPTGANPFRLQITFEDSGANLISLRGLGVDHRRYAYVVLETSAPGETIDVNRSVRVYNANGKAIGALSDLQFDYFITPSEDFYVRGGKVYQFAPKKGEVIISVWDAGAIR